MTEKVFCQICEYLIRDTSYCTMKQRVVNTCMKKCDYCLDIKSNYKKELQE